MAPAKPEGKGSGGGGGCGGQPQEEGSAAVCGGDEVSSASMSSDRSMRSAAAAGRVSESISSGSQDHDNGTSIRGGEVGEHDGVQGQGRMKRLRTNVGVGLQEVRGEGRVG